MHSFSQALAIVALCACAYFLGIYLHYYRFKDMSDKAIMSIRYAAIPLMLVVSIVLASQLNAARDGFKERQHTIDEIASLSLQMDKALTYFGGQAALKAQSDFRDYLKHITTNRDALFSGVDRSTAEKFMVELQTLPVPAKDTGIAVNTKRFILELAGKMSLARYKLATLSQFRTHSFTSTLLSLWLATIFLCIGLTSEPLSGPAFWASLAVAVSVGTTNWITSEFERPTAGFIQVSLSPFERVITEIGD